MGTILILQIWYDSFFGIHSSHVENPAGHTNHKMKSLQLENLVFENRKWGKYSFEKNISKYLVTDY